MNNNNLFRWINNRLDDILDLRIQPSTKARLSKCRNQILDELTIDCVFDVGANMGQFALLIRKDGYEGKIISFEPTEAMVRLEEQSLGDTSWESFNVALSDFEGQANMFLSSNDLLSSSLLRPTEILNQIPVSFVREAEVQVRKLDSYGESLGRRNYLKIDAQGGELKVLKGGICLLGRFQVVEFESSLQPLYEDEEDFLVISEFLVQAGFKPILIVPTYWDKAGRLMSLDSIFVRNDS